MPDIMPLSVEAIAAGVAAVVALISLVLNMGATRQRRRLTAEALRVDIDGRLLGWADDVLDAMGRASQLVETQPLDADARSDVLRDLSVHLDRGRWHAPNIPDPNHGADKPAAYRGHRQPALNCIYSVYAVVEGLEHEAERDPRREAENIVAARRGFVSEVQMLTDPRRRREFVHRAAAAKRG